MEKQNSISLYERIGGESIIKDAVERLYFKILLDPTLSSFFAYDKMETIKRHQGDLLMMVTGGPSNFKGNLRRAHAPLLKYGLSDVHFDSVKKHFHEVLIEQDHAPDLIEQILTVFETTRTEVLGR